MDKRETKPGYQPYPPPPRRFGRGLSRNNPPTTYKTRVLQLDTWRWKKEHEGTTGRSVLAWMNNNQYTVRGSSLLLCHNLDHSLEAIRTHGHIWDIYVWAYTTMNVNEFLSPLIALSDGFREVRASQGEGQRSLISSRVRLLLLNALGVNAAYRNMPWEAFEDGVFHICVEGRTEEEREDCSGGPVHWYADGCAERPRVPEVLWRSGARMLELRCSVPA